MRVAEIALFTDDPDGLVAFYESLLGQPPASRWPGGATFALDGVTLLVHERGAGTAGEPPNVDHVAFAVADVDGAAARLGAAAREYGWGRSAYLHDPDGRLVELQ